MSHFAGFSYPEGNRRVTVRIEIDGQTRVVVTNEDGAVLDDRTDTIDPRDAHRLITDIFSFASKLSDRADGELEFAIGENAEQRTYLVSEYDLPYRGLEVARIVRMVATDILSGYDTRSPRRQGGPRTRRISPLGFLGWSLAFGFGFLAANIIGKLAMIAGALTGPYAFAISNTVALMLMTGSYYGIGQKFGEEYRGNANVWLPAVVGTIPFLYLFVNFGGAATLFSMIFTALMPIAAYQGSRTGY